MSGDGTMERIKTSAWLPSWRKDVIEYFHSCDRCQKAKNATGKRFGLLIHIQEASTPWGVTDGLAGRMIQTLEKMIRGFCAYLLEFKDSDGFTLDWCKPIPELELTYKTFIHASAENTPAMLEKGWNPKIPVDTLKKALFIFIQLLPTLTYCLIKPKEIDRFLFRMIYYQIPSGTNAVKVELSGEMENKHPTSPVSLVKHDTSSDKEVFPLSNQAPLEVPPLDQSEEKTVLKVLKERRLRGKMKEIT
ncbi:hypothetical protein O181_030056 [Austropuccinia psidii MF-1]|uniref:Integrase zinc-binding domain-containing protein n=1 Tax=Austropuccinia psidii MF-1 TaxID=1389203 RepID=A0A9Q3CXQ2_9BASI|nr:hypothetical protein [Austropuccinia psidii MF-1]